MCNEHYFIVYVQSKNNAIKIQEKIHTLEKKYRFDTLHCIFQNNFKMLLLSTHIYLHKEIFSPFRGRVNRDSTCIYMSNMNRSKDT